MKKPAKRKKNLKSASLGQLSNKLKLLLVGFFVVGTFFAAYTTFAATKGGPKPAQKPPGSGQSTGSGNCIGSENQPCGNTTGQSPTSSDPTSTPKTTTSSSVIADCTDTQQCLTQSPIVHDINLIINFLSAGVAIIVIGTVILGGVQYSMAGDKPDAVSAARKRIANGLMSFAVFLLIFAFLQWLIPGGIFGWNFLWSKP